MKRFLSVALPVTVVVLLVGVAFAQMGGPTAGGMGRGMMGPGMMGGGMMGGGMMGGGTTPGGQAGDVNCPGMTTGGQQTPATQLTEEKAKELAQQYADKYLKGFTVERVLPFTGMHMTMYQAELKGPQDETRVLHINPWGNVMPFGGPQARTR
jgi:hypothetical protein